MEMNAEEILRRLPHRYPFLLVDRILEMKEEEITGLKNVTLNEPFFQGHFPAHPVMPGVLIMEALAQTGGVLAFALRETDSQGVVYFMGMDKVRFRRPVRPGDQLILKLKLLRRKGPVFKMKGEAYVGDELAAEGELLATIEP
ncbi:3-hydroxyacyl-ACP dehydratase FabZ [Desulfosoma caldarium]|uniref:3-hydroxyacyl-[acyl-carrier-protein] dehydratase FabZ n=1 Tax=Desulfosoma caldarium TaxID=610254 RepID=A0A3N1UU18_9BACT|nr:3-hydroxyacyl-ACP dehydratase FabZ [Desulfosoma caldarium]ROQ92230.1 3-hydroxyacyl-[acyl-carrier-protein] dehydratase [Desulfosoma caldarium]